MQIANSFGSSPFPPSAGGDGPTPEIAQQIQSRQARYRRIFVRRSLQFWWWRILIIVLAGVVAGVDAQFFLLIWKETIGCIVAAPILLWMFKRVEVGLFFTALVSTALVPKAVDIKSLIIYPSIPFLFLLFGWLLVKTAFHEHKPILPAFKVIWPQIGLLVVVIVSSVFGQLLWDKHVPHKVNAFPILYDEIVGVVMYFIPLITIVTTTAALTNKEKWAEYIQRMFLFVALVCALILIVDFKRIGASVYTFRFTEPSIGWMTLRALAQIIGLGAMISYARFLYATRWKTRFIYIVCLVVCLLAVYFSLQNSWWFEVAAGLAIMTLIYSRRFFAFWIVALLPFIPLIQAEFAKLATIKTDDYYRLIIWADSLRVWSKKPWFGVGPGNFWAYDQRYTGLPIGLRNCTKSGLCVAHEGYLQILGELGPIGLFFWLSMIALIIFVALSLYNRSKLQEKPDRGLLGFIGLRVPAHLNELKENRWTVFRRNKRRNPLRVFYSLFWALTVDDDIPDRKVRQDRILGLIGIGLVVGSMAGDLFTSNFFLPPRQAYHTVQLPQVIPYWIMYGCIFFKDKLWRNARREEQVVDHKTRTRVMHFTGPLVKQPIEREAQVVMVHTTPVSKN